MVETLTFSNSARPSRPQVTVARGSGEWEVFVDPPQQGLPVLALFRQRHDAIGWAIAAAMHCGGEFIGPRDPGVAA